MSDDDPFASPESERTVIMPSPGGRSASARPAAPPPQNANNSSVNSGNINNNAADYSTAVSGLNPLLAAANPLLNLVAQLRSTLQHPDPRALRDQLAQGIKNFEARAKAAGISSEQIVAARYILCTLLDETAASTPWGGSGLWANHSLLVMFHNEAWGGEKFFQLLSKLAENVNANRDLLELMFVCLALGFEGRFRVADNGRAQLDALRERLAQMLKQQRGDYERDLSLHWQPSPVKRSRVFTVLPLWVAFAICGLLLVGIYIALNYSLNGYSDPVFAQIQSIRVKTTAPPPVPALKPRLATFLSAEIQAGLVSVRDDANRSVVTIRGDQLFAPGSVEISSQYLSLLARIADALNRVPGTILITGHTDNQPIRSLRFPSNWHLSQERARSVMQLLTQQNVASARMTAEGRADSEPVAANDTPADRARNRRVEVTLFATETSQ